MTNKQVILGGILVIILSFGFGVYIYAQSSEGCDCQQTELEIYNLRLDEATVLKGYTVTSPENDFKVGVVDRAVIEPVTVTLKKIPDSYMTDQLATSELVKSSPIWEFDIKTDDGELGVIEKPFYLAIEYDGQSMKRKVMYFWNKPTNEWLPLPSSLDIENNLIRSIIHLPYARVTLFDLEDVYEAWASWYPTELTTRNTMGCATNVYPHSTDLKVCRLDNLAKCVRTTVISVGPFIDGRVIDLTKTAFDVIGNPRGGVLGVRVEPIK